MVTFHEAELNHLREAMKTPLSEKLAWLEEACDFAEMIRTKRFARGLPVSDGSGRIVWSEREYLNLPEAAASEG